MKTSTPCETCSRSEYGCTGCEMWREHYHRRQAQINAYARSVCQPKMDISAKFRYAHPDEVRRYLRHNPCEDCQCRYFCNTPCDAYLQWWDMRMKWIRRNFT